MINHTIVTSYIRSLMKENETLNDTIDRICANTHLLNTVFNYSPNTFTSVKGLKKYLLNNKKELV